MANKQSKQPKTKPVVESKTVSKKPAAIKKGFSLKSGFTAYRGTNPYLPGLLTFFIMLAIALFTYKDFGVSFDEPELREMGLYSYNYIFHGDQKLFSAVSDHHGAGYQLFLVIIEKLLGLNDTRDIFLMRHLVTHIVFLLSGLSLYVLVLNLYKNKFLACLGNIIFVLSPRLYAHSFFNGGDIPFLCVFLASLTVSYFAFTRDKKSLFLLLGILCGFSTSIRIMGILLTVFILIFLLIDLINNSKNKEKIKNICLNALLLTAGFCLMLYLSWPYLWKSPVNYFIESLTAFSHYPWNGYILVNGKHMTGENISWTYFPIWFLITVPEMWLAAGFAGIGLIAFNFLKTPSAYLRNTRERNLLLYLICFFAPVLSVIFLHSVIYNDWRHLYFVYPPFLLVALYFINKLLQTKYKLIVQGVCILQLILAGLFMVLNHPFEQVYFNNLVSHANGYLHDNYEMEYWGTSYKQAMDHLLAKDDSKIIKVNCYYRTIIDNNILLLPPDDRKRIVFAEIENADYYITNFWGDSYLFSFSKIEDSITVLNSAILCVYKVAKDAASQKNYREIRISKSKRLLDLRKNNPDAYSELGNLHFANGQYDSAEVYAKKALTLNPNRVEFINNLAAIYGAGAKFPQAIELYQRSIRLKPDAVVPYTNIGLCYLRAAKYDSAVHYLNTAISVNRSFNPSYEVLANTYKAAGQADSARKYEAIAQKGNPRFKL